MASSEKEPTATTDAHSIHSSMTEMALLDQSDSDPNKTHHLLKHCLSNGQRTEALAHFSTMDVKEAAKEISKMGQRDLQSKFKLVYGTATHSNNNDWLRRKLYEAIGAAPIKATTKTKVRKPAAKSRKPSSSPSESLYQSSSAGGYHIVGSLERRSRRVVKGTPKSLALAQSLKYRRSYSSLPSSPVVGRSVIDMHRYMAHDIATSTSEEETGSMYDGRDGEDDDDNDYDDDDDDVDVREHGTRRPIRFPSVSSQAIGRQLEYATQIHEQQQYLLTTSSSYPPPSSLSMQQHMNGRYHLHHHHQYHHHQVATAQFGGSLPSTAQQQQQQQLGLPRRTSFVGIATEFFQSDAWCSDAWAETVLKAAKLQGLQGGNNGNTSMHMSSTVEDDDVMLLPVDLSAFDAAGSLL